MTQENEMIQKVENWNGNEIRFISNDGKEWQAIAKDVASALGFPQARDMTKYLNSKYLGSQKVDMTGSRTSSPISDKGISSNIRRVTTLTEKGIYKAIFHSHKKEAEDLGKQNVDMSGSAQKVGRGKIREVTTID